MCIRDSHYVVRSSWVIGDGRNFVKTMKSLSDRVADASDALEKVTVVDDQLGRLTFTDQMAEGILHLLGHRDGDVEPGAPAEYGTYNLKMCIRDRISVGRLGKRWCLSVLDTWKTPMNSSFSHRGQGD